MSTVPDIELSAAAQHLRNWTLDWSRRHWDAAEHLVWNPPGSMNAEGARDRTIHLVPNSAWIAYALLGERGRGRWGDRADHEEGIAAIERLLALQYDEPGTPIHGTFARFGEAPHPPDKPRIWVDYDPNWRQFVGTAFALVLEDHADRLNDDLVRRIERSIRRAVEGERDGRIPATYANPALLRAWLDAWYGRRAGVPSLVGRGEAFGRTVIAEHDRFGAFEEFNSPTYYGIDLFALRLWTVFPPTDWFAAAGQRIADALWGQAARFYNAHLANFCGPFTRSYHPDSTRSVHLFALWVWAVFGPEHAPVPDLEAESIDHGHDLMMGPLVARLAPTADEVGYEDFVAFLSEGELEQVVAGTRRITAHVERTLMIGGEWSDQDWRGWPQFLPVTAHWEEADGSIGVLWLVDAHVVHALVDERVVTVACPGRDELRFRLLAPGVHLTESPDAVLLQTPGVRLGLTDCGRVSLRSTDDGHHELRIAGPTVTLELEPLVAAR